MVIAIKIILKLKVSTYYTENFHKLIEEKLRFMFVFLWQCYCQRCHNFWWSFFLSLWTLETIDELRYMKSMICVHMKKLYANHITIYIGIVLKANIEPQLDLNQNFTVGHLYIPTYKTYYVRKSFILLRLFESIKGKVFG